MSTIPNSFSQTPQASSLSLYLIVMAFLLTYILNSLTSLPPSLPPSRPPSLPASQLSDAFLVAKAYFDTGEYRRAAHVLKPEKKKKKDGSSSSKETTETVTTPINQEELFLRCYATYLAGEKVGE